MNANKEKAREAVNAILEILPSVTNEQMRAHLLEEKRKQERYISLCEIRERAEREASRRTENGGSITQRETRLLRAIEQR